MKKILILIPLTCLMLILVASTAFSWGAATHAYIADQIGKTEYRANLNELYGAMAPDVFNYMFGISWAEFLSDKTHGTPPSDESFLEILNKAKGPYQRALAYGFICHNDVWGADSTAHYSAIGNPTEGYVITKATELMSIPAIDAIFDTLFSDPEIPPAVKSYITLEFCHNIIEGAGDIIIAQLPQIAEKVTYASRRRNPSFGALLAKTYAAELSGFSGMSYDEAMATIIAVEREFRNQMILNGQVLMEDTPTAVAITAGQFAEMGMAYLAVYGIDLPPGITPQILAEFAELAFWVAINILGDYMDQVTLTIEFVEANMVPYMY